MQKKTILFKDGLWILKRTGKNIQLLRKARGMSRESLALEAEMSPSYLFGVEKGRHNCSLITLYRLSRALGVKVDFLLADHTGYDVPPYDYSVLFYGLPGEYQSAAGEIIKETLIVLQRLSGVQEEISPSEK